MKYIMGACYGIDAITNLPIFLKKVNYYILKKVAFYGKCGVVYPSILEEK